MATAESASPGPALALSPSVITLSPGQSTTLELTGSGFGKGAKLPVTISFDASRLKVDQVEPGTGVLVDAQRSVGGGWVVLTIQPGRDAAAGPLARLKVTTLTAGPAPVVCAAGTLTTAEGVQQQVSAVGSAVYVDTSGGEKQ